MGTVKLAEKTVKKRAFSLYFTDVAQYNLCILSSFVKI